MPVTFDDRIEQLALLLSGLNKRVAVLELRLSPQVNAPSPPEAPAPPAATPTAPAGPPIKITTDAVQPPPDALAAYQQRCKARLVAKAQENLDLLPYWIQHALQCGWIKPGEGIEALLTNDAEVFWLEAEDPGSPNNNVRLQFENMAAAVAKLAESNCPF